MATKPLDKHHSYSPPPWNEFTIERREIVATITPSASGIHPLVAAYNAIGEYMVDNDAPLSVEFKVFGMRFSASSEYDNPVTMDAPTDDY